MSKADLIVVAIMSVFLGSCCPQAPVPTVHVAGYYNAGAEDVAAYWRDDEAGVVPLYELNTAHATSMAVSGSDVYVAGLYKNAMDNWAAGYWKNGELVPLYSDEVGTHTAGANAIAVSGSKVYVAGWINEGTDLTTQYATVWKDGSPTTLWGTSESEGLGVAVSGADVYVSGYYTSVTKRACWWMNDTSTRTDLYTAASSKGLGVAVSGSDVYVAGYYSPSTACYWKNDQAGIANLGADGQATSVFVSGSDVYVAGYYKNANDRWAAGYWKNGGLVPLYSDTTGTNDAYAYSIFIADGVVYAAGYVNEGSSEVACYWNDGVRVELYRGATAVANSIWVD